MIYNKILVTGGGGFIGSNFIESVLTDFPEVEILNIDNISYCTSKKTLSELNIIKNYSFASLDIRRHESLKNRVIEFNPELIVNFAAESHVDNSILNSDNFISSNIIGTHNLLCIANESLTNLKLFHQISTDEVFGDLNKDDCPFTESSHINPSSPYSASKASADHLVTAWGRTFKIPFTISICTNNYGPFQFPEKLLPKIIMNCITGKKIPVYGDGKQIRDWLYVDDHVDGIIRILFNKKYINQKFNISGDNQIKNIDLVNWVCNILNETVSLKPKNINNFKELITFVKDRPGHDRKYFLNSKKIKKILNWKPKVSIHQGLALTIKWYLNNIKWTKNKM